MDLVLEIELLATASGLLNGVYNNTNILFFFVVNRFYEMYVIMKQIYIILLGCKLDVCCLN